MKKTIFSLAFVPLFLTSCISVKYTTFEVKEPANITFSSDIVNVLIVDNALVPSSEGTDMAAVIDLEVVTFDSAKVAFVESLYQQLNDAEFFGEVQLYPYEMRTGDTYWQEQPLLARQITEICAETGSDALISLDNYFISSSRQQLFGYPGSHMEMSLTMMAILHIYTPDGKEMALPLYFSDTLYWSEVSEYASYQPLPTMKEAIDEITEVAANAIGKQFTPYWESQIRAYFPDKQTETLLAANRWEEALLVWEKAFDTEKKDAKRSRLAFNIALANEYLDKLDKATEWMATAEKLLPDSQGVSIKSHFIIYGEVLRQRQASRAKLKEQIGD